MNVSIRCTVASENLDVTTILEKFALENPTSRRKGEIAPSTLPYRTSTVDFDAPSLLDGTELVARIKAFLPGNDIEGHIHMSLGYTTHCSLDFSEDELAAIVKSGSTLSVTCYRIED